MGRGAAGKGKGKGGRGGKGRKHKVDLLTQSDIVEEMIPMLAKMCLQNAQTGRDLKGILVTTYLLLTTSPIIKALLAAGQDYHEKAFGGNDLGSPHLHIFAALAEILITMDIGGSNREAVKKLIDENFGTMESIGLVCKHCKVVTCWDDSETKLELHLDDSSQRLFDAALAQTGAKRKPGRAPPTGMERAMQKLLEKLEHK